MTIKRYVAATVREAMRDVRRDLGDEAVILSNKRIGGQVEILAAAPDAMQALVERSAPRTAASRGSVRAEAAPVVAESFQEFIRRQSRSRAAATPAAAPRDVPDAPARGVRMYDEVAAALSADDETAARGAGIGAPASPIDDDLPLPRTAARATVAHAAPAPAAGAAQPAPAVFRRRPAHGVAPAQAPMPAARGPAPAAAAPGGGAAHAFAPRTDTPAPSAPIGARADAPRLEVRPTDARLVAELQAMRALLHDQLAALTSSVAAADAQRRNPLQVKLMTRLLTAGFSPELARRVASNAPAALDAEQAQNWLQNVLAHNLKCVGEADGIVKRGGVYALIGPTGVGKTTTVAKLAARHAVRHGAASLGLITLDAYRIGAHEQLRTYGRILGTPVHLAQDGATLRELLASMQGKRLVLIDTCGVSQRDERLAEMMNTLATAGTPARPVARVLLLNSASHAETVDDVARAWRAREAVGAILTKLDEAARIGGAVDALLRYKLALFGLTNGQRVPEDWHPANARLLAHLSLKPAAALFALGEDEGALLAQTVAAGSAAHA